MSQQAELLQRALDEIRRLRGERELRSHGAIAIVGAACRFPGAEDLDAFWRQARAGADAITAIPEQRFSIADWYDPDPLTPGKMAARLGGFLPDVQRFDAGFFEVSPREAAAMDPRQRILLELSWNAIEAAGLRPETLAGTDTGVYLGLYNDDYAQLNVRFDEPERIDTYVGTGNSHAVAAGRLAYFYDLRGPALVVDTACSSSLVAVHQACQALRSGECSLALAGAASIIVSPLFYLATSRMLMLAPGGRCRTFDASAEGFVRSEGCGLVLLERLEDALAHERPILAVIRGTACNQDGRTNGLTAPSAEAQRAVIEKALADARSEAVQVGYVEAHGTGTQLGDLIEAEALLASYCAAPREVPLLVGSAKSRLGHCEAAAGMAGLLQAALAVRCGELPPTLHFERLNPHIEGAEGRLQVVDQCRAWPSAGVRRAGISAFGWSGTNAHVIVEEPPERAAAQVQPADDDDRPLLLPLSARSEPSLRALAGRWAAALGQCDPSARRALVAAATARQVLVERAVFSADAVSLPDRLERFATGAMPTGCVRGRGGGGPAGVRVRRPGVAVAGNGPRARAPRRGFSRRHRRGRSRPIRATGT